MDFDEDFNVEVSKMAEPGQVDSSELALEAAGGRSSTLKAKPVINEESKGAGDGFINNDLLDYLINFHCPPGVDETSPQQVFAAFAEVRLALLRRLCDEKLAPAS